MTTPFPRVLRRATLATALLALPLPSLHAADVAVAGVRFEEKAALGGSELTLNGAGLRTRMMLKVYAIALYVPKRGDSLDAIAASIGPKRIQIVTLRDLTAEQFADGLIDGLKKNHSDADYAKLQARADEFRNALLGLKSAPSGSQIRIEWIPSGSTRLIVGNEVRGRDIPGDDFFRALLKIWLGEKPVDSDLKNTLLGKS